MKTHYSEEEKVKFILEDLEIDAKCAENQAAAGEFYPERGITKESLLAYSAKCRELIEKKFTSKEFIYNDQTDPSV